MNEMLNSIKSDLLSRRLLPLVGLLGLALIGAIAFALLGGSGGSTPPSGPLAHAPSALPGPAVVQARPGANAAVAETTSGKSGHNAATNRNPFKPLPESGAEKKAKHASSSSSTSSTHSSSAGGASSSPSTPAPSKASPTSITPPSSTKPAPKPKVVAYRVTVLFGKAPAPGEAVNLTTYSNLKRMQALPSLSEPRLVFMGASPSGKGAIFSLVTEAIVHGSGTCLPSASQCEGIDLRAGKSEELDYLEASGQTTVYTLTVQSIAKRGTNAVVARRAAHEAVVARRRLQQDGHSLAGLGLRYSIEKGLLLWGSHRSAPAHHAAPKAPVLSDDLG